MRLLSYYQRKYSYWSRLGVPGPRPWSPLGTSWTFFHSSLDKLEPRWLAKYGNVFGFYMGVTPYLSVADPELIKLILVKDFSAWINRDTAPIDHELFNANLMNSQDEQWRRIRAITSPSFTTGKLKGMHTVMNRCIDKLAHSLDQLIQRQNGEFNAKELLTGFTADVIGSTSFGIQTNINSVHSKRSPQDQTFLRNCIRVFQLNPLRILLSYGLPMWVNKLLGNELFFDMKPFQFFGELSREIVKQRMVEAKNHRLSQKRADLIQLLMDAFVYEDELMQTGNYDKLAATMDSDGKALFVCI